MSVKELQSYIGEANIADKFKEESLIALGSRVRRQYDEDLDSMSDWNESIKKGLDLMRMEYSTRSTPWPGASNYKDSLLTRAAVQFGDKAALELLRGKDLVTAAVIGKDPEGEKKKRCDRVTTFMNYQVNYDMNDWRDEQEKVFYIVPNSGVVFKKTVFEPEEGAPESHTIQYPDFVVNQATKSMNKCRSFSQNLDFSKDEINERVANGLWLDPEIYGEENEIDIKGDTGSNEEVGVINPEDNPDLFVEQQTFFDLDGDGREEPYIVTFHYSSKKIVRIVARFDEKSIMVKHEGVITPLPEVLKAMQQAQDESFGGKMGMSLLGITPEDVNADKLELVRIKPFQNVTKYGFIPSLDGTFLELGYAHLLGGIVQSLNATTNQLNDAGTLANLGGGYLSKEFRKSMGIDSRRIGQWKYTDVPAEKFAKGMFPNPSQEPSQVLFQLNEKMHERGEQFLAVADISGKIDPQTAPTTALAIIQEGMVPTSALFKRILNATSKEFKNLYRLNKLTLSSYKYQRILDDEAANVETDFIDDAFDIKPTANAEMSSKMHRIQTATIELEQFDRVLQAGGNPVPIVRNFFDAIGSDIVDQIFPEEGMNPQQAAQMEELKKATDLQNQIQKQQLEILSREQDRLDAETKSKIDKTVQEMQNMQVEMFETMSKTILNGEKAETEQVKNQIDLYTADFKVKLDVLTAIGAEHDRNIAQSNALNPRPTLQ